MKGKVTQGIKEGLMCLGGALFMLLVVFVIIAGIFQICEWCSLIRDAKDTETAMAADLPSEGVGRVPQVSRYLGPVSDTQAASIAVYCEDDGPAPAWYRPDEPMAVEWVASYEQVTESNSYNELASFSKFSASSQQVADAGCPDWNVDTTLWGWDGHGMEAWEMELFARIVYLEFWGTSAECVEAGVDSILRLWDMGEYGDTIGELLSAQYAPGCYVYSPYAYIWEWEYDADGLADIRAMCEERFADGPEWEAPYFRLWYYHDFGVPAYEIDGVYFSVPRSK